MTITTGKTAMVTGGGRGIGASAAEGLAKEGFRLVLCSRTGSELSETAKRLADASNAEVLPIVCDVSIPGDVAEMTHEALAWADGIDVLVNNAGIPGPLGQLDQTDPLDWRRTMDVNLHGMVNCTRALLPAMKHRNHGKIINIVGGGVGWKTLPKERTAYVASKFAAYGFTEALAVDLKDSGIQVNALSPGPVLTRSWNEAASPDGFKHARERGHDLSPDSAARMIAFLASDASGSLTGKIFSARGDNPDDLVREMDALNASCRKTLRKIDDVHYTISD